MQVKPNRENIVKDFVNNVMRDEWEYAEITEAAVPIEIVETPSERTGRLLKKKEKLLPGYTLVRPSSPHLPSGAL